MKLRLEEPGRSRVVDLPVGTAAVLGRQSAQEMNEGRPPLTATPAAPGQPARVILAWAAEFKYASQEHVELEAVAADRVRVTNRSGQHAVRVGGRPLAPGRSTDEPLPVAIDLAERTVTVESDAAAGVPIDRSISSLPPANLPLSHAAGFRPAPEAADRDPDRLLDWLQTTLGVLQGAIGSVEFLPRAVEALVEIVGLSSGCVLLRAGDRWAAEPVAAYPTGEPAGAWRPSPTVLAEVLASRQVFWRAADDAGGPAAESVMLGVGLAEKGVVVAAPLVDGRDDVTGVLYGELPGGAVGADPDRLKLALVKVLASGVSAGLARQKTERDAALFEAFFSKQLSDRLRRHPDMLDGKTATVTVLFCDIRGYSTLSARLDPGAVVRWLHDVLGEFSRCVLDERGVVVDYIGDELMAMWGAPEEQPDQTDLAVRAGLAMLRALPGLDARWRGEIGADLGVGIGVHRGEAVVGNCGTRTKFKYGPLGDTVNRASRVQGLTKYLKCPLLITDAAHVALTGTYTTRRVVRTRLAGIDDPVSLFEVAAAGDDKGATFKASQAALDTLEQALGLTEGEGRFDGVGFSKAAREAGKLLGDHPGDGPLILTLSRATDALIRDGRGCTKIWTPPGK